MWPVFRVLRKVALDPIWQAVPNSKNSATAKDSCKCALRYRLSKNLTVATKGLQNSWIFKKLKCDRDSKTHIRRRIRWKIKREFFQFKSKRVSPWSHSMYRVMPSIPGPTRRRSILERQTDQSRKKKEIIEAIVFISGKPKNFHTGANLNIVTEPKSLFYSTCGNRKRFVKRVKIRR
jgi:hypothetical protein